MCLKSSPWLYPLNIRLPTHKLLPLRTLEVKLPSPCPLLQAQLILSIGFTGVMANEFPLDKFPLDNGILPRPLLLLSLLVSICRMRYGIPKMDLIFHTLTSAYYSWFLGGIPFPTGILHMYMNTVFKETYLIWL